MIQTKVGGAALNQLPLDWDGNFDRIVRAIKAAKAEQVNILCLPELAITGYGCEDLFFADWFLEKAQAQLLKLLPFTKSIAVAVGLPLKYQGQLFNVVAFISNGKVLGINAKRHLANSGVYYEARWFQAWPVGHLDTVTLGGLEIPFGDQTYLLDSHKIGIEICEEAWQTENRPVLTLHKFQADVILCPNGSHFTFGKSKQRKAIVEVGCKPKGTTFVYCNLLGNETGRKIFDGEILIGHSGQIVAQNQRFSFSDINLVAYTIGTKTNYKVFAEHKETVFTQAISLGLFDYMRRTKTQGFVLSLSGGADSAACAVLVAEMAKRAVEELGQKATYTRLGLLDTQNTKSAKQLIAKLLTTAYQSTENSSSVTKEAANAVATELGATHYNWDVQGAVDNYVQTLANAIGLTPTWKSHDLALQNIQARSRAPIIWLLANMKNALLITTSNRSEAVVGYCTMDGDTAGSIAPIGGVDKHFVRAYLVWAEKYLGYKSLKLINKQQPTAELRPAEAKQTDEADLMPYRILSLLEFAALEARQSPAELVMLVEAEGYPHAEATALVSKFLRLWAASQWKRERLAPTFDVDIFNVDPKTWCRFPILSAGYQQEIAEIVS